jgi:hypothetical protein
MGAGGMGGIREERPGREEWRGGITDRVISATTSAAPDTATPRGVEKTPAASATTEEPAAQTTSTPDISDKSWFKQLRSRKAGGPAAATSQSTPDQQQPAAEKASQNPPPVPQRPSRGAGRGR